MKRMCLQIFIRYRLLVIIKKTIEMMIVWIFEEKNLERLIWVDPYGAFDILY
jgi:hypothetical protein